MTLGNPTGFARVSRRAPKGFGICDTCGYLYNRIDLVEQVEFYGNEVKWTGSMVCTRTCSDKPQAQLTSPILPPDPEPLDNPRPETAWQIYSQGLANNGGVLLVTDATFWQTSVSGLPSGGLWSNNGTVTIHGPTLPNPLAQPILFGRIYAIDLLSIGGSDMPISDPHVANQIWNSAGVAHVSAG